jgi:hypothetical protein
LLPEQVQVMFDNLPISLERIRGGECDPCSPRNVGKQRRGRPRATRLSSA